MTGGRAGGPVGKILVLCNNDRVNRQGVIPDYRVLGIR